MFIKTCLIFPRLRRLRIISALPYVQQLCLNVDKFNLDVKRVFSNIKAMSETPVMKPLNVLVYTGEDFNSGDRILYNNIAKNLRSRLHSDCYTVYLLTPLQVVQDPWEENLTLLVISCELLSENIAESFRKYIEKGGKILNFGSNLTFPGLLFKEQSNRSLIRLNYKNCSDVSLYPCRYLFECSVPHSVILADTEGKPKVIQIRLGNYIVVVSDVHLEIDASILDYDELVCDALNQSNDDRLNILQDILSTQFNLFCCKVEQVSHTACFLLSKLNVDFAVLENSYQTNFRKLNLKFLDYTKLKSKPSLTDTELPVLYNFPDSEISALFDKERYFSNLKATTVGQMVFFVEVVGTTMAVIQSLPNIEGAVVVACLQTVGKGRRGNSWITPRGAAAFSAHLSFPLRSPLGQKLPLIQHFIVLSLIKAVRNKPGYEDIDVQIKWPNDVYYERRSKIGGVLVNSTIQNDTVHIYTGSGLNVNNSKPTMCINEIIKHYNSKTGQNLPLFTVEELIARSLNELEELVMNYQENKCHLFFQSYYKYWMHAGQTVTLNSINELVTIVGIDEYGFLLIETKSKKKITLQPDGNSFDIMKNLIVVREI